jgi:hypothetical protein
LLAKGEDFRHQFKAMRKKGASKGIEKREGSHKREENREIQIQKWVSSIRGRSCKCKLLKVGLDFRYAQQRTGPSLARLVTAKLDARLDPSETLDKIASPQVA